MVDVSGSMAGPKLEEAKRAVGLVVDSLGARDRLSVVAFSDGCDRRGYDEVGDERGYLARLESAGSESLGELLRAETARGRPVRAVVYDTLLVWVPRVARRHGVASAAFFTHPCAVTLAYAHAWARQLTLPVRDAPPELPGVPVTLGLADLPKDLSDPDSHIVYRDLMLKQCQALELADHVLINSFHELQAEVIESAYCYFLHFKS